MQSLLATATGSQAAVFDPHDEVFPGLLATSASAAATGLESAPGLFNVLGDLAPAPGVRGVGVLGLQGMRPLEPLRVWKESNKVSVEPMNQLEDSLDVVKRVELNNQHIVASYHCCDEPECGKDVSTAGRLDLRARVVGAIMFNDA